MQQSVNLRLRVVDKARSLITARLCKLNAFWPESQSEWEHGNECSHIERIDFKFTAFAFSSPVTIEENFVFRTKRK